MDAAATMHLVCQSADRTYTATLGDDGCLHDAKKLGIVTNDSRSIGYLIVHRGELFLLHEMATWDNSLRIYKIYHDQAHNKHIISISFAQNGYSCVMSQSIDQNISIGRFGPTLYTDNLGRLAVVYQSSMLVPTYIVWIQFDKMSIAVEEIDSRQYRLIRRIMPLAYNQKRNVHYLITHQFGNDQHKAVFRNVCPDVVGVDVTLCYRALYDPLIFRDSTTMQYTSWQDTIEIIDESSLNVILIDITSSAIANKKTRRQAAGFAHAHENIRIYGYWNTMINDEKYYLLVINNTYDNSIYMIGIFDHHPLAIFMQY